MCWRYTCTRTCKGLELLAWEWFVVPSSFIQERPYKCLMNGCNMSFNTPEGLQRHILRHFDTPTNGPKQSPKVGRPFQSTGKASPPLIQMSGDDTPPPAKKLCQMEVSELSSESGGEGRKGLQHSKPVVGQLPIKVRKRRCSFKVRIPRHRVMISPPLVRGPTPFNGESCVHTVSSDVSVSGSVCWLVMFMNSFHHDCSNWQGLSYRVNSAQFTLLYCCMIMVLALIGLVRCGKLHPHSLESCSFLRILYCILSLVGPFCVCAMRCIPSVGWPVDISHGSHSFLWLALSVLYQWTVKNQKWSKKCELLNDWCAQCTCTY